MIDPYGWADPIEGIERLQGAEIGTSDEFLSPGGSEMEQPDQVYDLSFPLIRPQSAVDTTVFDLDPLFQARRIEPDMPQSLDLPTESIQFELCVEKPFLEPETASQPQIEDQSKLHQQTPGPALAKNDMNEIIENKSSAFQEPSWTVAAQNGWHPSRPRDIDPFPEIQHCKPYVGHLRTTTPARISSRVSVRLGARDKKWEKFTFAMKRASHYSQRWRESIFGSMIGTTSVKLPMYCPECFQIMEMDSERGEWTCFNRECKYDQKGISDIIQNMRDDAWKVLADEEP